MRKALKPFIITITLLLPAAIYIFLRLFGENQFEIPVYYQSAPGEDSIQCENFSFPHKVDLSIIADKELLSSISNEMFLIDINATKKEAEQKRMMLERIFRLAEEYGVTIIQIISEENKNDGNPWQVRYLPLEKSIEYAKCELFLLGDDENVAQYNRLVLIDKQARIRGYYETNNFEEIDRLLVEIKILVNQP